MLARLNIFPSEVLSGRYSQIPFEQRICILCGTEPDSVVHILCLCPALKTIHTLVLGPNISSFSGPPQSLAGFLLQDNSQETTASVADFLVMVLTAHSLK